jgi:hypothetical protein
MLSLFCVKHAASDAGASRLADCYFDQMKLLLAALLIALSSQFLTAADAPVYWLLWFDTEDYIEPASDDAALRLARELEAMGIKATFKIVGEKARVLEERGRRDVIAALARHDIGYHSNNHSIPPTPAVYMQRLGLYEGAQEFERREGPGLRDLQRIFGMTPSCYGQPGNSWGPQANLALRKWGVPVYMDDGDQIGYDAQPFWLSGMLYVFNLKQYTIRADLNDASKLADTKAKFDAAVAALKSRAGGVIQTYYHPTEWAATEFWDGVNFRHAANPAKADWKRPQRRTPESQATAYKIFFEFARHAQKSGVKIITAREFPQLVENARPGAALTQQVAMAKLRQSIDSHDGWSAAELLTSALGVSNSARHVEGPERRGRTSATEVPRWVWEKAKADTVDYIHSHAKLPPEVWAGNETIALGDFTATLAAESGSGAAIKIQKGDLAFEKRVTKDAGKAYNWVIHAAGFAPEELLELARLQAWTLKPAQLRK